MSASLAPECNENTCAVKAHTDECAPLFKDYKKCLTIALKERGIDKMLEEAREDHKENDADLMGRKSVQ
ncbi:hypothetical protein VTL71DRAFT_11567 [Oculimacula yallundae]|uniref:Uncharacterized protein n=1 Tax=Oculimacula yallundae TaxID=86028 RepID=A0ABR4CQW2_9HELO